MVCPKQKTNFQRKSLLELKSVPTDQHDEYELFLTPKHLLLSISLVFASLIEFVYRDLAAPTFDVDEKFLTDVLCGRTDGLQVEGLEYDEDKRKEDAKKGGNML